MGWVIGLAVANEKAFMYGGSKGCGFRWEPNNITVVDLKTKNAKKFSKVGILCVKLQKKMFFSFLTFAIALVGNAKQQHFREQYRKFSQLPLPTVYQILKLNSLTEIAGR